jgi:hypothetical protein
MKKLAKGCLVRLDLNKCFTTDQGGSLRYPMINYHYNKLGIVESRRPVTSEETRSWYASDAAKGLTDDGETKLPPQSKQIPLHRDTIYMVLRARCRIRLGWGNPVSGMAKLLCTETGEETYVKRDLLEII